MKIVLFVTEKKKIESKKERYEEMVVKGKGPCRIFKGKRTARPRENMNKDRAATLSMENTFKESYL